MNWFYSSCSWNRYIYWKFLLLLSSPYLKKKKKKENHFSYKKEKLPCIYVGCVCVCVLITQSCPTLYNPMDCSPPGFSVHEILQARIQEWVASSFSRGFSWSRNWTQVRSLQADSLLSEPPGKPQVDIPGGDKKRTRLKVRQYDFFSWFYH